MELLLATFFIFCIATSNIGFGEARKPFNVVSFGAVGDGKTDDSQAFTKAWRALCGARRGTPNLVIPAGRTFLLKPVTFEGPCKSNSVHIQVQGKIIAPNTIEAWNKCHASYWIGFVGVANLKMYGSGTIDGQGSAWWRQTKQANNLHASKIKCDRPNLALSFQKCDNLQLSGLTHVDSPRGHIGITSCHVAFVYNLKINAPGDSPNTDGIDLAKSTNVQIQDSVIGTGDDCVAINGGCSNINITKIACGPGHGISVGSLGNDGNYDIVEEVHVQKCNFTGTENGARIKTYPGGSGYVRRITYEQITLNAAGNPIIIDQHYCNGKSCDEQPKAIAVRDVTFTGFRGTSSDEKAITLDCAAIGCNNIKIDQVSITSSVGKPITAFCSNAHGTCISTSPAVPCLSGKGFARKFLTH